MLLLLSDIGEGDVAPRRALPALLPTTWVLLGINLHDHRADFCLQTHKPLVAQQVRLLAGRETEAERD